MTSVPGALGPIHHVGFVVRDLDRSRRMYEALGYRGLAPPIDDDRQDAAILFLAREGRQHGEPLVELVEPRSEGSPVYAFSIESRFRIHHLCFAVADIRQAEAALRAHRVTQVMPAVEAPAIGGSLIAFFHSRETGLFELVQQPTF
ncbi:MAG: VOC family protein [Vicinamibacterales bacterium]